MVGNAYSFNNVKQTFLSLLPVQIFSFITSSLSGIVNGLIIGSYLSNLDMIALGFASPIVQFVSVTSMIVSAGARIVCGKYIGRGEDEKVNNAFTTAMNALLVISVVLTLIGLFLFGPVISNFSNIDSLDRLISYIKGISIGIIPTLIVPCLMVFLQMKNKGLYALMSTLVLALTNLSLDLIYVNSFNPTIFGIGVITSISQYITLIFIVLKFVVDKDLPRLVKGGERYYKETIIIGFPTALANMLYAARNSYLASYAVNTYGNDVVNAISILNSSCGPIDAVNIGINQAALMLTAVAIGEKDKEGLNTVVKIDIIYGGLIATIKMVLTYAFAKQIGLAFGAEGQVITYTRDLYRAYAFTMPFNIITCALVNTYQSFGKAKFCNILYALTAFIVPIGFVYLAKGLIGVNSIWYCYFAAEILIILTMYIYACIKHKRLVTNLNDILILNNELDVGEHLTITIKDIEDVTKVAEEIEKYCLSENIEKKKAMLSGLVSEEVTANIIEHGFTKTKKKNKAIDIFVDVDNEDVIIRIKDNAVPFDPHVKLKTSDDPTVNIGIKMVAKIAKEMNYQTNFGFNVLTINM